MCFFMFILGLARLHMAFKSSPQCFKLRARMIIAPNRVKIRKNRRENMERKNT